MTSFSSNSDLSNVLCYEEVEMSDALPKLWLPSAEAVRMTCPSFWTMSSLSPVHMIRLTPLQIGRIGRTTRTLRFTGTAAVVACFSVGTISKRLRYYLRDVKITTLVSQYGGLHSSAVHCYLFAGPLFVGIIHPLSWRRSRCRG